VARKPGPAIPAATGPAGKALTVADLASFIPGEQVAGKNADPPLVELRVAADERARRAATTLDDQPVIVDDAKKNGWIAGVDALAVSLSPRDLRRVVTLELFATTEGAAAYAAVEAPYWNPQPARLDDVATPEIPGARSYRVQQTRGAYPVTQINVARGPVYIKVASYDNGSDFTAAALDGTIETIRDVIARVDKLCGSSCTGDPASAIATPTPPTLTVPVGACVDFATFGPTSIAIPKAQLTSVSCTQRHDAEVLAIYKDTVPVYPASKTDEFIATAKVGTACANDSVTAKKKANAKANGSTDTAYKVFLPSPAEFDAEKHHALCVIFPDDGSQFTAKYLPAA
jgi:hypothetical protein